jgi:small nuclear ribonucleoprotein (snRNP)-like protein
MAEQRSPLKEFRHLDEKLRTVGLSVEEQARWGQLREIVATATPLKPGFDVKAAAAELKASLEPAGRRRPAAPPAPVPAPEPLATEPEPVAAGDIQLEPQEAAGEWLPAEQGPDAAALSWEAQPGDTAAQAWDAGAPPADPGAQPYDPNALPWDAAAQPAEGAAPAWDAAQADLAAWDPGAPPADPDAQPAEAPHLAAEEPDGVVPATHDASAFAAAALDFSGGELSPEGSEALEASTFAPEAGSPADPGAWAEAQPEPAAEPGPWAPEESAAAEGLEFPSSQDPGEAVPPPAVEDAPPLEMASAADFLELAAAAQAAPAPVAGQDAIDLDEIEVEEIPTVDVEEILEEVPPAAAVAAAPEPAPAHLDFPPPPVEPMEAAEPSFLHGGSSASFVAGEHRVVVHTVEGQVLRGSLVDVDLDSGEVPLGGGGGVQLIPSSRIKAIFFMLLPGGRPPQAEGKKVRVTFRDGRQVAGFSGDYDESHTGFFMIPADTRTNTGRIWVYRDATRQVSVT